MENEKRFRGITAVCEQKWEWTSPLLLSVSTPFRCLSAHYSHNHGEKEKANGGTRTHNLWIRSPMRYPIAPRKLVFVSSLFLLSLFFHIPVLLMLRVPWILLTTSLLRDGRIRVITALPTLHQINSTTAHHIHPQQHIPITS